MAITLGRQLTDDEKGRVLQQHGRLCFATGHPVGDDEPIQFDHSYEQSRDAWLTEIVEAQVPLLEKGRWFGAKLVTQWLDVTPDDEAFVVCDSSGRTSERS